MKKIKKVPALAGLIFIGLSCLASAEEMLIPDFFVFKYPGDQMAFTREGSRWEHSSFTPNGNAGIFGPAPYKLRNQADYNSWFDKNPETFADHAFRGFSDRRNNRDIRLKFYFRGNVQLDRIFIQGFFVPNGEHHKSMTPKQLDRKYGTFHLRLLQGRDVNARLYRANTGQDPQPYEHAGTVKKAFTITAENEAHSKLKSNIFDYRFRQSGRRDVFDLERTCMGIEIEWHPAGNPHQGAYFFREIQFYGNRVER